MGKLFKDGINSINSTLIQTITDLQNLRPVIEDMRYELTHTFGMTDSASGSVASFSDGAGGVAVKDVKTTIEPVQNLNGYTRPWVGGAGKNILSPFVVGINISTNNGQESGSPADSSSNSATDYIPVENANYVLSKDGTIDSHNTIPYFYNANKEYLGRKGGSATNPKAINIYDLNAETETMTNRTSASLPIAYVRIRTYGSSSNLVYQSTIDSAKCQLEKGSSATTYEPYQNICPITGWDSVKIANDPKQASFVNWNQKVKNGNFADGKEHWSATSARVLMTAEHNAIKGDIVTTSAHTAKNIRQAITTYNGHKYYAGFDGKFTASSDTHYLLISLSTDSNNTSDRVVKQVTVGAWKRIEGIITASQDCSYLTVGTNDTTASGDYFEIKNVNLIDLTTIYGAGNEPTLEEFRAMYPKMYYEYDAGSVSTQYAINTDPDACITKELGQTVYGGTLDLTTGVLTITHKMFSFSSASSYGAYYGHNLYYTTIPDYSTEVIKRRAISTESGQLLSNYFTQITETNARDMLDSQIRTEAADPPERFYFNYDTIADLAAFNAQLASTPLQVLAELATPVTYQLTPEQLYQFTLDNNIFSDCGTVEVTYRLNLSTAISRLQGA